MDTTQRTAIRTPDLSEVDTAGMAYPVRPALAPQNHAAAVALFRARHAFWVAAAEGYMALVEAGCTDAVYDVRQALAQADLYAPTRKA